MKKSERLQVIIDLQANQEMEALEALGRCQQKRQQQQAQLESLQNYQQEYQNNLAERQRRGMNINQLLEFRAFADKLDKAIEGQRQTVQLQEREVQYAQKHWEEAHQRRKSLQKVSDLARAEELKLENKREQVEQDARAARTGRRDGTRNA